MASSRTTDKKPIDQLTKDNQSAPQSNEFSILNGSLKSSNPMVNTIGLQGIAQKLNSYSDCDEFLGDIDALVRSYSIQFGDQPHIKEVIDSLSELCHRDVKSIRTCPECFENWAIDPNDYFTKVCSKPHLIVYAKAVGFKFWPAKVMSVNRNTANVAFFGDHTQADAPVKKCFLYPKRHSVQFKRFNSFSDALLELDTHIKKIEEKFGSLHPAGAKVLLDPQNMETQLMAMIPGAFGNSSSGKVAASNEVQSNISKFNESSQNVTVSKKMLLNNEPNRLKRSQIELNRKRKAEEKQSLELEENSRSSRKVYNEELDAE